MSCNFNFPYTAKPPMDSFNQCSCNRANAKSGVPGDRGPKEHQRERNPSYPQYPGHREGA